MIRVSAARPVRSSRTKSASRARSKTRDAPSTQFDALLESMQTPEARTGVDAAFNATPEALGQAAVKAARRRS
jgi:antitoxin Phd